MMFRLSLIGLIPLVLLPTQALADVDGMDFSCESLDGLDPISEYTEQVIERAEDGLAFAREAGVSNDFLSILPSWALSIGSAWAGLTDTTVQRTNTVNELFDVSACLHFDMALLDCKMEEVRQELRAQTSRGSFLAIFRLTSLLQFLNERRRHLQAGALDPQYPDPTWGYRYAFDRAADVWCLSPGSDPANTCEQKPEADCVQMNGQTFQTLETCVENGGLPPENPPEDTGRLCPFNADYAPAFDSGFGCDIDVMEPRKDYPPLGAELNGLKAISGSLSTYRRTAVEVLQLQQQMNSLFDTQTTPVPATRPREHLNAFGCGWTGGWCSNNDTIRCTSDDDCGSDGRCEFPNTVCEKNRAIRCTTDAQCGSGDQCIDGNEPALRSTRGSFSLDRDQLNILGEFLGTRSRQEISRVFRDDLQTAAELPLDDDRREERAAQDTDPAYSLFRSALRIAVQSWSRRQARDETLMYPEGIDAPLETAQSLTELHKSVSEIARIASDKTGLRDFVTRYAWFMQRSCIYRPCSMLLEQVIRLTTTDECFPYANGEYLGDTSGNPRWQKCKDAAEI